MVLVFLSIIIVILHSSHSLWSCICIALCLLLLFKVFLLYFAMLFMPLLTKGLCLLSNLFVKTMLCIPNSRHYTCANLLISLLKAFSLIVFKYSCNFDMYLNVVSNGLKQDTSNGSRATDVWDAKLTLSNLNSCAFFYCFYGYTIIF